MELELEKNEELDIELMRTDEDIDLEILDIGNLELSGAGIKGDKGEKGEKGDKGDVGVGIPSGGNDGDFLVKNSNDDFDTQWIDIWYHWAMTDLRDNIDNLQYNAIPNIESDIKDIKQRLDNLENN